MHGSFWWPELSLWTPFGNMAYSPPPTCALGCCRSILRKHTHFSPEGQVGHRALLNFTVNISGSDHGVVERVDNCKEWPVPFFCFCRGPSANYIMWGGSQLIFVNSTLYTFVAEVSQIWLRDMGVGHIHSSLSVSLDGQEQWRKKLLATDTKRVVTLSHLEPYIWASDW